MTKLRRAAAGAVLTVLALTAAACTGGGGDESLAVDAAGGAAGAVGEADGEAVVDRAAPGANRTTVRVRSVIRTGELAVTGDDLDAARAELDGVLVAFDGVVDTESTQHDRAGRIEHSTVVVRIPVDRFEAAMTALQDLGTVQHSDSSSRDVTTEVIDVDERVETLQNSLDRLQRFQRDAAAVDDLLDYEQQITEREAELQSLKAQQAHLADQTSMSTITVHLSVPEKFASPPGALDDAGFLAGLESGWNALRGTVVVLLTVAGAVLPFALVLGLVGAPLWLVLDARSAPAPRPTCRSSRGSWRPNR